MRCRHTAAGLCLIIALTWALVPIPARADDRSGGTLSRMPAGAFVPIGRVYSLGDLSINGRRVYGEQMIWAGELLQVSNDASACVVLDSIGLVGLERGAELRAATTLTSAVNETGPILILSLISGNMFVKLQENASAYIEACGSEFTTTNGVSLRIEIRGSEAFVDVTKGEVRPAARELQPEPIDGKIVTVDSRGSPVGDPRPKTIKTQPNAVEKIAILLTGRTTGKRLSAGRLVRFLLLNPAAGRFNSPDVTVPTNDYGVAIATFTAGPNRDQTKVTATVVGCSEPSWEGQIKIEKPRGLRNKILLGAAVAAAAAIIIIVKRPKDGPLKQLPPPMIP